MTQPFPAAAPCLVPPSAATPTPHPPGTRHGLTMAADHLDEQADTYAARARVLRVDAARHDDTADVLRAQARAIRSKADALGQ